MFTALTRISSQVKGDVTIQEMIFLEFIFIVQVIDFKLLHVSRDLGPPIPLDTLVEKADRQTEAKARTGTSSEGAAQDKNYWSMPSSRSSVLLTSCILVSKVQI